MSLDENAAGFSRDGIGRQSMSEKRHATLDAKNTDTYRRNKKMREERQQNSQSDQVKQKKISNKIAEIRQELLECKLFFFKNFRTATGLFLIYKSLKITLRLVSLKKSFRFNIFIKTYDN